MPRAEGILFCGGGTGGHVMPGLAVAAALRARGAVGLRWIGDPERVEATLVPGAGIPLLPLGLSRPRLTSPRWLVGACTVVAACWRELSQRPPRVVVALGGYASLVPGLLAPLRRRPLVVMEQNARAGRTNRLLARFARAVITQFDEAGEMLPLGRVCRLGNPVRRIVPQTRGGAPRLTVLVAGGSLAAKSLNDLVLAAAPDLAGNGALHLVHLAGEADRERVAAAWTAAGAELVSQPPLAGGTRMTVEVHGFMHDMVGLYRRVDIALGRSGATTVAELCSAGIGALYVPLPWAADDHQTANANSVARCDGALVLPQATTSGSDLAAEINRLTSDRARVRHLGAQARRLARPRAAEAVAILIERCLTPRPGRAAGRVAFQRQLVGADA